VGVIFLCFSVEKTEFHSIFHNQTLYDFETGVHPSMP
jgi:hypothetical protein